MGYSMSNARLNSEFLPCQYSATDIQALVQVTADNGKQIGLLAKEIESMSSQIKDIMRWLLLVVSVIALGSKIVEMLSDLWIK